jgi:CheY-like chemotaxis protein
MLVEPKATEHVMGNAAELREVLVNLVFNAVDAMPEGGTITLSSSSDGKTGTVQVRDTGVGIPASHQARVFDPFFTTKGPSASGLGLSASYGIVSSHQGTITVESEPGRGAAFTVSLPVADRLAGQKLTDAAGAVARRRVLLIDDDDLVRDSVRHLLESQGHEVFTAAGGPAGLELLGRQEVDLVVTDLGMPEMSGWEVADRVKDAFPELRVVMITGWGAQLEAEKVRQHRIDAVLTKPFKANELFRTIAAM